MRLLFVTGLLALAVAGLSAHAADSLDCKHATVQMDMNECADRDYQAADKKLNAAYRAAIAQEDAHGKDLLKAAEKTWMAYRDAQCTYDTKEDEGGSIQPMDYSNCLSDMTKARTKQLSGK